MGLDERPPDPRRPPPDLVVAAPIEPPAEQVSTAAFVAKALAAELRAKLDGLGLVCTRVRIEAETEHGELLARVWRSDVAGAGDQAGGFDTAAIAERVRWQLDGWLAAPAATRPTGGIALLRLVPDELAGAHGRQLGFWGGDGQADERAMRALARVQGLLGHDAVVMPVLRGGRGPGERVAHVPPLGAEPAAEPSGAPSGEPGAAQAPAAVPSPRGMVAFARALHPAGRGRRRAGAGGAAGEAPWPGRVPAPGPAIVHARPLTAELLDDEGAVVSVTGRGELGPDCGPPARLWVGGLGRGRVPAWATVTAWAGPWTAQERWWDRRGPARRDRFQVLTGDGHAYLLALVDGAWWVEATYD
jgi:protein ImuB